MAAAEARPQLRASHDRQVIGQGMVGRVETAVRARSGQGTVELCCLRQMFASVCGKTTSSRRARMQTNFVRVQIVLRLRHLLSVAKFRTHKELCLRAKFRLRTKFHTRMKFRTCTKFHTHTKFRFINLCTRTKYNVRNRPRVPYTGVPILFRTRAKSRYYSRTRTKFRRKEILFICLNSIYTVLGK